MLLLTKEEIQSVFNMNDAIDASEKAFAYLTQGVSEVPLRTNIDIPNYEGQSLFMPAYVEPINAVGIKIVSVFPKNIEKGIPSVPAKVLLLDGTTGDVVCIMEGTFVTQIRTGAAAGVATKYLANADAKIGALFGTGGQASAQLEAMLCARKLETVRVFDIDYTRAQKFAEAMNEELARYGASIIAVETMEEMVDNADVITAVTTAKKPVFDSKLLKPGCHVNGVGSYTPDMQELDENLITHAGKLYIDSRAGALAEAGDLLVPLNKGTLTDDMITGEIGQLIMGKTVGRESDTEITVFKTVGTAVLDVVTAYEIYQKAKAQNIGTEVNL